MKNVSRIIPCYAADTAGVCSMLYELGGMTVVHDASGCNSTYATHDEPRWYDMQSMIYISALTEIDAIMGDDEKFIADVVSAVGDQSPRFVGICGSPMPMMTGMDFDAAAMEIQRRTGVRTFALHTNGTHSYIEGASEALLSIVREYVKGSTRIPGGVNILGLTPLDFPWVGTADKLRKWLEQNGFTLVSSMCMGTRWADIERAAGAEVNLVVSQSGVAAAEYMQEKFGIPYVCGVPIGREYGSLLADALRRPEGRMLPMQGRRGENGRTVLIGEGVYMGSLAGALRIEQGLDTRVICPLPVGTHLLAPGDLLLFAEEDIEQALAEIQPETVIADPLYRYIVPAGTRFVGLPHFAFSGRCFAHELRSLIDTDLKEFLA